MWLRNIEEFTDYVTQGEILEELQENLKDIYYSSAEITPRFTQDFSPPRHKGTKKKFSVQFWFTSLRFLGVLVVRSLPGSG